MHIILERFAYLPDVTLGKMQLNETVLYTVEQPWADNTPFKSCVPDGEYKLVQHATDKVTVPGGVTYSMVNEELNVFHYPDDIPDELEGVARYVCLFGHIANYPRNVQGCAGFGKSWAIMHDPKFKKWVNAVTSSREATNTFFEITKPKETEHTLSIVPSAGAVL